MVRDFDWGVQDIESNSNSAGNTQECRRKEIPTYICAAVYAFQRPLNMQITLKLVHSRRKGLTTLI